MKGGELVGGRGGRLRKPRCTALHCATLRYTALHCATLRYTANLAELVGGQELRGRGREQFRDELTLALLTVHRH